MNETEAESIEPRQRAAVERVSAGSESGRASADAIEEFARLFLRRAALDRDYAPDAYRVQAIRSAMSRLAARVQYDLDGLGAAYGLGSLARDGEGAPQRTLH